MKNEKRNLHLFIVYYLSFHVSGLTFIPYSIYIKVYDLIVIIKADKLKKKKLKKLHTNFVKSIQGYLPSRIKYFIWSWQVV